MRKAVKEPIPINMNNPWPLPVDGRQKQVEQTTNIYIMHADAIKTKK